MTKRTRSFVIHVRARVRACVCVADPSLLQDYIKFGHIHTLTSQLHSILLLPLQNLTLFHSNTPLQNSAQRLHSIEYTVPEECDADYFMFFTHPLFLSCLPVVSSCKHVTVVSIRVENSVDPYQMASSEADEAI